MSTFDELASKATPRPWVHDQRNGSGAVYPEADCARWNCLSGADRQAVIYYGGYRDESGEWAVEPQRRLDAELIVALANHAEDFKRLWEGAENELDCGRTCKCNARRAVKALRPLFG